MPDCPQCAGDGYIPTPHWQVEMNGARVVSAVTYGLCLTCRGMGAISQERYVKEFDRKVLEEYA